VELAAVQMRNNEIQVKAGTAAPIDVISAETQLELRKDAAIAALPPITQAENSLKILLLDDPASPIWSMRIEPTDSIDVTNEPIDLQTAIGIALDRRPEIKQLEAQGELNDMDLELFKNQAKPQVDLVANFGGTGLGGAPIINSSAPPGTTAPPNPMLIGGYGTGLGNIFDFRSYTVGVTISFPFRNRAAKANIAKAEVTAHQLDAQKRQMIQQILSDVRNAVQNVDAARLRVDVAHAGVVAAQEQLKGEEQKFSAGLSTTFLVLSRQTDLATAQGNELKAKTDYFTARATLQQVMANNLP
jgi:HAE1 family hydrophobic/amphiphilic exporter-1